jgi:hypothetical protein
MSTDLTLFAILVLVALAGYAAGATFIARRPGRRYLPTIATVVATIAVAGVLAYLHPTVWSTYNGNLIVRDVAAYTVAACLLLIPAIIVTTKLANHFATAASPPIKSWALTWAAAATVLLLSSFIALWAAVVISGDGP